MRLIVCKFACVFDVIMSSLFSCCCCGNESDDELSRPSERERLIPNGANNDSRYGTPILPNGNGGVNVGSSIGQTSVSHQNDDEQAMLRRILQDTASNIIDVGAIDNGAAPSEYTGRVSRYDDALKKASAPKHHINTNSCILQDIHSNKVAMVLGRSPMDRDVLNSVHEIVTNATDAIQKDIKVTHTQDLIVHLSIN